MRIHHLLVPALCLLLTGCGNSAKRSDKAVDTSEADRAARPDTDALWALAPADIGFGAVAAAGALLKLQRGVAAMNAGLSRFPEGRVLWEAFFAPFGEDFAKGLVDPELMSERGLDLSKGAALFGTDAASAILVYPVGDREAFVKYAKGESVTVDGHVEDRIDDLRCRIIAERYVCVEDPKDFSAIGRGKAMVEKMASRPASLRGHVELWSDPAVLPGDQLWDEYFRQPGPVVAAVQLGDGGFTVRGHLAGQPANPMVGAFAAGSATNALSTRAARGRPAGLCRINVPVAELVGPGAGASLQPTLGSALGIDVDRDLLQNLTGEFVAYPNPGDTYSMSLRVGLRDSARLASMPAPLCSSAPQLVPQLKADHSDQRCRLSISPQALTAFLPQAAALQQPVTVTVFVESGALAVDIAIPIPVGSDTATADATSGEFMTGAWNLALWSQGTLVSELATPADVEPGDSPLSPDLTQGVAWLVAHVSELSLGAAVREDGLHALLEIETQFANPDPVLQRFQSLVKRWIAGDRGAVAELDKLAAESPDTHFGRSYRAGLGGFATVIGFAGFVTSFVVRGFTGYALGSGDVPPAPPVERANEPN